MSVSDVDVAIVGGGPAGSTAAALLARRGVRVVVFEKERFPRFHIGESLLPCDLPIFARLGTASNMFRMCFAEASGKPDRLRDTSGAITAAVESLRTYVERLPAHGWKISEEHREAAHSMLLAALISDSLGREGLPGVHPPESRAPEMYARAFLALLQLRRG